MSDTPPANQSKKRHLAKTIGDVIDQPKFLEQRRAMILVECVDDLQQSINSLEAAPVPGLSLHEVSIPSVVANRRMTAL